MVLPCLKAPDVCWVNKPQAPDSVVQGPFTASGLQTRTPQDVPAHNGKAADRGVDGTLHRNILGEYHRSLNPTGWKCGGQQGRGHVAPSGSGPTPRGGGRNRGAAAIARSWQQHGKERAWKVESDWRQNFKSSGPTCKSSVTWSGMDSRWKQPRSATAERLQRTTLAANTHRHARARAHTHTRRSGFSLKVDKDLKEHSW